MRELTAYEQSLENRMRQIAREEIVSIIWGNLESHDRAWEQAKRELAVEDVRELTTLQFRNVIARAEQIRKDQEWEMSR